jgi:hypothetical protein
MWTRYETAGILDLTCYGTARPRMHIFCILPIVGRSIAPFSRLLPNLCNLTELSCVMVKFHRAAVPALCTLSKLTRVQLTRCFCDERRRLGFAHQIFSMGRRSQHVIRWRAPLARYLRQRHTTWPYPPLSPFSRSFRDGPIPNFPNVQRLSLVGIGLFCGLPAPDEW